MKPFDLQAALRGEPVVTRDGRRVSKLRFAPDKSFRGRPIEARIQGVGHYMAFTSFGNYYLCHDSSRDLFMADTPVQEAQPAEKADYWILVDADGDPFVAGKAKRGLNALLEDMKSRNISGMDAYKIIPVRVMGEKS